MSRKGNKKKVICNKYRIKRIVKHVKGQLMEGVQIIYLTYGFHIV